MSGQTFQGRGARVVRPLRSEPASCPGVQEIAFDVPDSVWLTANHRPNRWQKAGATSALRELAGWSARAAGLLPYPTGVRVRVTASIHGRVMRLSDPTNANPTTKALLDGLVDVGVFADDNHRQIEGPDHRWGRPIGDLRQGVHRVVFTITPIDEGAQSARSMEEAS